jgi:ribose transport system substrate-binding protein
MSTRKLTWIVSILALAAMILAACAPAATPAPAATEAPAATVAPVATQAPAATVAPAKGPIVVTPDAKGMIDTTQFKKVPPYTLCFSNASVSNSWRVALNAHVTYGVEEAKAAGLVKDYRYADANDDPNKQISDVEDLLTKGCDVLILSAAASDVVDPAAKKAMDEGVPVITLDRDVADPAHRVAYVQGDNCLMGANQAKFIVKVLNGKGNIVLLSGAAGASPAEDRLKCARDVFKANPGIVELEQAYTNWSPTEGQKIMAAMITKYGSKIDAVWSDAGLQGAGAINAYLAAGLKVPPITGEDFQMFLRLWHDNNVNGYACSFPTRQGYDAVKEALDLLQGKPIEALHKATPLEITNDNLAQYYNPKLPDDAMVDAMPQVLKASYPDAYK